MAKTVKKTRESQYDEILSGLNKTFAQCSVLGFRFPDEAHAHGFHYGLMNARVDYLLFDSTDDGIAVVIIPASLSGRLPNISTDSLTRSVIHSCFICRLPIFTKTSTNHYRCLTCKNKSPDMFQTCLYVSVEFRLVFFKKSIFHSFKCF